MATIPSKLKEEAFCVEFIKEFNGTQSAIAAGYAPKSAAVTASKLLIKPNIKIRIAELMSERMDRVKIDADYILQRLAEIDQMDVIDILAENGELKPIRDWPKVWRTSLSGIDVSEINGQDGAFGLLKKIKWPDKVKNIELLGKHIDVQAFKDNVKTEVTGLNNGAIITVEMTATEAADAYKDLMG